MTSVAGHPSPGGLPPLSDGEFRALRDFVYEKSGLFFADAKKFLFENRVQRRLQTLGLSRAVEYHALLRSPGRGPKELLELLDAVTTHETSFFRNQPQIDAFRNQALRSILDIRRKAGTRTLRIWSAACSSGEEPYTLAILLLEELGDEISRWKVRVVGTDVAQSVLEKANAALYNPYSLRNTTPYYLKKYFDPVGPDTHRLRAAPKSLVEFHLLNFADDVRMRTMSGFQVVFCRNALIYFDREAKRRFVSHFSEALDPGGYLFVGHSESLHGINESLRLVHFPGAMAYQKPEVDSDRRVAAWNQTA